jgi:Predicted glycosyltransferases
MSARIAVVVVAFRSADVIPGLLDSLSAASREPLELVVVDNSDIDDGLAETLRGRERTTLVPSPDNPGYGAAVNRALPHLGDAVRWVVVANPDVVIEPGAIDTLVAAAERLPDAGAVGPLIRDATGEPYPSARNVPSLRTGIGHALFVRVWPGNPWTARYRNDSLVEEREAGWLSGAFLLLSREAFEQIGGFDERYFMYFEDVDLGRRLTRAGWRNYYVPSATVSHVGATSTRHVARSMIRVHHASAYRFLADKYQGWYLFPLRATLRAALWLRSRIVRG